MSTPQPLDYRVSVGCRGNDPDPTYDGDAYRPAAYPTPIFEDDDE